MDYTLIFSQFSNFVIAISAFILCLSIIVFVHEFGHYFIGKVCGIHAEVFSVGFGPVLLSMYDKDGTKWQVAALPFGGYVKFWVIRARQQPKFKYARRAGGYF